jgi:hypothetical protein
MAKVILNKSTKIKSKGFVLAGVEVDVTAAEEKDLSKRGFIGNVKKSNLPSNQKEIDDLIKKVSELEKSKGVDTSELTKEIETLKSENETLVTENLELKTPDLTK